MWQNRYTYDDIFCFENYKDALIKSEHRGSSVATKLPDPRVYFSTSKLNTVKDYKSKETKSLERLTTHVIICHDYNIYRRIHYYVSSHSNSNNKQLLEPVKTMILSKFPLATTSNNPVIRIQMDPLTIFPFIMSWYKRIWHLTMREHLISYTSTYYSVLGGAYCSLGKQNTAYAYKAGVLAIQQIKLARKLKDPILEYKCWLYFAEDLIQLNETEKAEKIIRYQEIALKDNKDYHDPTNTLNSMLASVRSKLNTQKNISTRQ